VAIEGGFWAPRQVRNREVTIPYGMKMLEESGTLENFRVASGDSSAEYQMPQFRDSDLYKVLEAIGWERAHGRDDAQEEFLHSSAATIAKAQAADGYINTYVQTRGDDRRFADPAMGHELYCAGHLTQAAVADMRTSRGDTALGGIASRFAAMLSKTMSTTQTDFVPGHPEIETALVELYRTTGDARALELATELVARRGQRRLSWRSFDPSYFQDDIAVAKARTIRGHAVRALYLLAGATDVYVETGDEQLLPSLQAQWLDMISTKTYLTGGVGSRHKDEAFGDAFELPPDRAYCETCASIASVMWNWRMLLLTGESRFADLVERTLYNGLLAGIGLDGTSFFYVNPLQSRSPSQRSPWYDCACCPPNVMRLLASLEHYVATCTERGVQIHQYMSGRIRVDGESPTPFEVTVTTGYPYDGEIAVRVEAAPDGPFELALRVPEWTRDATLTLNGHPVDNHVRGAYLRVSREWSVGDEVTLTLELRPRTIHASGDVDGARGCVAFERGPLVYCIEGADLDLRPDLRGVRVDPAVAVGVEENVALGNEKVVGLQLSGHLAEPAPPAWPYRERGAAATSASSTVVIRAIPYFAWGNRGATSMRVWIPETAPGA
jgi:DUF1680 family protein